jgi:hypothetical protein
MLLLASSIVFAASICVRSAQRSEPQERASCRQRTATAALWRLPACVPHPFSSHLDSLDDVQPIFVCCGLICGACFDQSIYIHPPRSRFDAEGCGLMEALVHVLPSTFVFTPSPTRSHDTATLVPPQVSLCATMHPRTGCQVGELRVVMMSSYSCFSSAYALTGDVMRKVLQRPDKSVVCTAYPPLPQSIHPRPFTTPRSQLTQWL